MTPLQGALFAVLAMMVLVWFVCVNRLSRQLRDRHPATYDDMRLAEMWPQNLLQWFQGYNNARPVVALLRFLLRREDAALNDTDVSRLSRFMRWFFGVYIALFLSLVFLFLHHGFGDVARREAGAIPRQQREAAYRLHREERWQEALARYDQLLGESERDAELHYYRAAVRWQLNQLDQALEDFRRVIELEPTNFDAHRYADRLLSRQGRWDEILEMWNAYIERAPTDAEAYFERGGTNFHRGDLVAAQADAAQACRLGKADGCVWEARFKAQGR